MNYNNNLELSVYLRSFGIFDTNIISAIEVIPIELFKTVNINQNFLLKKKIKINLMNNLRMLIYQLLLSRNYN